jgi:hypothetical protein
VKKKRSTYTMHMQRASGFGFYRPIMEGSLGLSCFGFMTLEEELTPP